MPRSPTRAAFLAALALLWACLGGPPLPAAEPAPRAALGGDTPSVSSLAYSPDGKTLLSTSGRTVTAWDTATNKGRELARHPRGISGLTYSPDGKHVAWIGSDDSVQVWDVRAGKVKATLKGRPARCIAFLADGKSVAWAGKSPSSWVRDVRVWDFAADKERTLQEHGHEVFSLTAGKDGKYLAWACGDHSIKVWDVAKKREVGNHKGRHVLAVAFAPDGKTLASAEVSQKPLKLLDAATGKELLAFDLGEEDMSVLAFSPDGKALATASIKGKLRLFDVATGKQRAALGKPHLNQVRCLAFSPDGKTLATGGQAGGVKLWDLSVARKDQ